jgi:ferritin-like metal-binding protein YciE
LSRLPFKIISLNIISLNAGWYKAPDYGNRKALIMAIQNPQDLFLFQLAEMYDIEQRLVQALPELAQETENPQVRQAFLDHEQETHQHVRNIEQCFQLLGYQPMRIENQAVAGLKQDHDAFVQKHQPSQNILTLFDLNAGSQSEYLEMANYQALIETANALGYQQCVPLFQQNLQQEMATAQKLAAIAHQLGQQGVQAR